MNKKLILGALIIMLTAIVLTKFRTDVLVDLYGDKIQEEVGVQCNDIVVLDHSILVELFYESTGVEEEEIAATLKDGVVYVSRDCWERHNPGESPKHATLRFIAHECEHYKQQIDGTFDIPEGYYTDESVYSNCFAELDADAVGNAVADKLIGGK